MLVYKWIENIFIVRGYNRDCIYDPLRREYYLVPAGFQDFVSRIDGSAKNDLILDDDEGEWLEFLLEKEFLFNVPKEYYSNFTKTCIQWNYPNDITNSIICYPFINKKELNLLDELLCKHLLVILPSISELQKFLNIKFESFGFQSIDIYLNHGEKEEKNEVFKLIENHDIIGNIYWFSDFKKDQNISFMINFDTFMESHQYHTYFNRKLYINSMGEIHNAPESMSSFGKIRDFYTKNTLRDITENKDFQRYWYVHKELCDVCKDCEFRHMCIDSRIPYQRSEQEWYHKTECSYNPYICKWKNEEGYRTLSECGVISNEHGFSIDHECIAKINKKLWE